AANGDGRMAIAEARWSEAGERRWGVENSYAELLQVSRSLPDSAPLVRAWAALDLARADVAAARRAHDIARRAEEESRTELLDLPAAVKEAVEDNRLHD